MKTNKGRPPSLVAKVDEIDGTEFTFRGAPVDIESVPGSPDRVRFDGREYVCRDDGWPGVGEYRFRPVVETGARPLGRPASVVVTVASRGVVSAVVSGELVREPDITETGAGLEMTHKGRVYGCEAGSWPGAGNYPMRYLRAAPKRETVSVNVADWWEREKRETYSPEMCEAYRDAALLMLAAGREIHPDYWNGVPEEYRV